jgi:UDP-glucose 4-epimerase
LLEEDVRDAEAVNRAVSRAEVVFHLAASVGNVRSIEHPIEDSEINIIGTLRVLEAARRAGVPKVVLSSSAAIFGEPKTLPVHEDHPAEPDSPYGASKLAAEKLCLAYSKLYGIQVVSLRYFNVYGINQRWDDYGNVIPIFAHRIVRNLPVVVFGDGEQTRDFVNVRDVARANIEAAFNGAQGAFNIASGGRITVNRLAELMVELSGAEATIEHCAPRKGDVRHILGDISAARAAFGYEPTVGLEEGLAEYMAWARKEIV